MQPKTPVGITARVQTKTVRFLGLDDKAVELAAERGAALRKERRARRRLEKERRKQQRMDREEEDRRTFEENMAFL